METDELIKRSLKVSIASFLFGTGFLVLFFFTNLYFFALTSIPVIFILGVANFILLVRLVLNGLKDKENRTRSFLTGAVISLNIPIVFLYIYFVFILFDTIVVRIKNDTDKILTNITLTGCDQRTLQDLRPGQTEIEWIPITKSCVENSLIVSYEIDGVVQREVVDGYVVEGRRINHKIGNKRN